MKRFENNEMFITVAPFFIKKENPLSTVQDVFNAILVEGNAVGVSMFYGRGAGKLPTASAVVADIIDCAKHTKIRKDIFWSSSDGNFVSNIDEMMCSRYVRFSERVDEGKLKEIFGDSSYYCSEGYIELITAENDQKTFDSMLGNAYNVLGLKPEATYKIFNL
jgi:homoserine dehydrogenase